LERLVTEFVAANPGLTLPEIARGVTARKSAVLEVLSSEAFSAAPRDAYLSDRAQVYTVAAGRREQSGTAGSGVRRPTQEERIMEILADGEWHSSHELHRRVFCVLHSRVANLRRKGRESGSYDLQHKGGGAGTDVHWYRLVWIPEAADPPALGSAASGVSACGLSPESASGSLPGAETPAQLELGEAA
jgi:hypothetical protein